MRELETPRARVCLRALSLLLFETEVREAAIALEHEPMNRNNKAASVAQIHVL